MTVDKVANLLNSHFRHHSEPLEVFNGIWTVWWAIWMLVFGNTYGAAKQYSFIIDIFGGTALIGIASLLLGALQLFAVKKCSRHCRADLALLSGIAWVGYTLLMWHCWPAFSAPFFVNYGMAALGQAWVYWRLTRPWR